MGLEKEPRRALTIETYTEVLEEDLHVKCIGMSEHTQQLWVHNHHLISNRKQCLETGEEVVGHKVRSIGNLTKRRLRINHYYHNSRERFLESMANSRLKLKKATHWNAER